MAKKKKATNKTRKHVRKKSKKIQLFFLYFVAFIILLVIAIKLSKLSPKEEATPTPATKQVEKGQSPSTSDATTKPRRDQNPKSLTMDEQVRYFAEDFGILGRLVTISNKKGHKEVQLPLNAATSDLNYANFKLSRFLTQQGWRQTSGRESTNLRVQTLTFTSPSNKEEYQFLLYFDQSGAYPLQKPKIAIVIKGFGDLKAKELERWLTVDANICFAVLPISRISRTNIVTITNNGYEALIQLPLEAPGFPAVYTPPYAIFANYRDSEVQRKLDHYYRLLPKARGTITSQGGLITTDTRIMPIILNYFKQKNLYFIDDKAIETSIAYTLAQEMVLTSYEKSISFNPAQYKNDTANARLASDIKRLTADPIIVTLQQPDDDTFAFLQRLITTAKGLNYDIVKVSNL